MSILRSDPVDARIIGGTLRVVEGIYGPGSEAWRLNREAVMLMVAGPRALLLQVAHPLVAAGVDQHSGFRTDPWRRLEATIRSFLTVVYGRRSAALGEIARLNGLHRDIRGPVPDAELAARFGETYTARDPELSLWVHATLVDSTIVAYDALVEPLSRTRRERFYAETRPVARLFGVPDGLIPADYAGFEAYVAAAASPAGPVHPTDASRDIAWHILHPPFGPLHPTLAWIPRSSSTWTFWPAVALLPSSIRAEYGLSLGPIERTTARWLTGAWRAWRPLLPEGFRQMRAARDADARIARARAQAPRIRSG
ncbi:MAG TPA: oxygenase MpaB family protein [Candidatus Limnocylindrales bacterium]|nr:oxygenase MpaB family protein [Candidatus Limnocylindrales bacterium]